MRRFVLSIVDVGHWEKEHLTSVARKLSFVTYPEQISKSVS